MAKESDFEADFLKDLYSIFKGSIVLKNNPNLLQGFPDRLILFEDRWAAFEFKRGIYAPKKRNQEYYVDLLNKMSYAAFVYPENAERVLNELQQALGIRGTTRIPFRE